MSIVNRRNAFLGWIAWTGLKFFLRQKASDAVPKVDLAGYDFALAGSPYRWGDYAVGEKIDHLDAMTLEEAEHQIATRLYQNTARVHFNQHEQAQGQFNSPDPASLSLPNRGDFTLRWSDLDLALLFVEPQPSNHLNPGGHALQLIWQIGRNEKQT